MGYCIIMIGEYASKEYRELLGIMKMQESRSRKGNCWVNAPTEQFFQSFKLEYINFERFRTKEAAKLSIIDYLAFYNGKRLHSNTAINPRSNMNGNFIRNLLNKVSCFS
jgi:transposase InsO family protein